MRKIIVLEFISLDGVLQAPGGTEEDPSGGFAYGGWTVPLTDDEAGEMMKEQMKPPFDLLLGRKTYDIWAGYWPKHADAWPGINEVTKYVASRSPKTLEWSNSVLLNDVVEDMKKLKAGDGPNLHVYGSGNLVQTLLKNDLVDELWLKIFPVTLGSGKKLFGDGTIPAAFTATMIKAMKNGVIYANYARGGEVKTGSF